MIVQNSMENVFGVENDADNATLSKFIIPRNIYMYVYILSYIQIDGIMVLYEHIKCISSEYIYMDVQN